MERAERMHSEKAGQISLVGLRYGNLFLIME